MLRLQLLAFAVDIGTGMYRFELLPWCVIFRSFEEIVCLPELVLVISPSSHPIFDLGLPLEEALDDKVLQSLLPLEDRVWQPLLPLEDKVLHSLPPSFFFKHGA